MLQKQKEIHVIIMQFA